MHVPPALGVPNMVESIFVALRTQGALCCLRATQTSSQMASGIFRCHLAARLLRAGGRQGGAELDGEKGWRQQQPLLPYCIPLPFILCPLDSRSRVEKTHCHWLQSSQGKRANTPLFQSVIISVPLKLWWPGSLRLSCM